MPQVPFNPDSVGAPQGMPKVAPEFLLAAAQDLHQAGQLVEVANKSYNLGVHNDPTKPQYAPQTGFDLKAWPGSDEDKQRALNLLYRRTKNQKIDSEASDWLDGYMEQTDKHIRGNK